MVLTANRIMEIPAMNSLAEGGKVLFKPVIMSPEFPHAKKSSSATEARVLPRRRVTV